MGSNPGIAVGSLPSLEPSTFTEYMYRVSQCLTIGPIAQIWKTHQARKSSPWAQKRRGWLVGCLFLVTAESGFFSKITHHSKVWLSYLQRLIAVALKWVSYSEFTQQNSLEIDLNIIKLPNQQVECNSLETHRMAPELLLRCIYSWLQKPPLHQWSLASLCQQPFPLEFLQHLRWDERFRTLFSRVTG